MARSLESRIVWVALIATISALLLTFSIYQYRNWVADRDALAQAQLQSAQALADVAHRALDQQDWDLAAEAVAVLRANDHATAATFFAADGRTMVLRSPPKDQPALVPAGQRRAHWRFLTTGVQVHAPHYVNGRRVGELVLRAHHRDLIEGRLRNIAIALALSAIATAAAGFGAQRLARRALAPLQALEQAMETVAASRDFTRTVDAVSDDEVGRLTRHFNRLLGALRDYDASLHGALAEVTAARDAAEEANVAKSQFLANMSHEIRTPLNGVLGMAQIMALHDLDPAQRERLEVIGKSGESLLAVLNDILDLSKIEAGRLEIEAAPFDLEEVAGGACAVFTSTANAKGLSFALSIADTAKGRWLGDSVRIRQILYNLVSNALKFTEAGEVRVTIEPLAGREGLQIAVTDTGIGIAPEHLAKLFDKFVQADASTTRRFGGSGLGLTICRSIAELMGGTIEVESKAGAGSVFRVVLPLARLADEPAYTVTPETSGPPDTGLAHLRVLAAEDNETNQLVLKTVLHALGVTPLIVENGRLAVEAWARGAFDIVLMDIQMPVLDGVGAVREIRRLEAERGLAPTRVLALSANAMKHQVAEYLDAGMDGHLAKPLALDKLYAALTDLPASRRAA